MERYVVDRSQAGISLCEFISQLTACSKKQAKRLVDSRRVFVNGRRVWIATHQLGSGDKIELPEVAKPEKQSTRQAPIEILWQSKKLLILNKPAGQLSNGAGSYETAAAAALKIPTLKAVHRLDRDTSGCLIFARDPEGFEQMKKVFEAHSVEKIYVALVKGVPHFSQRTVRTPIDGKPASSSIRVKERFKSTALVEIKLETGRMHQIRIHMQELGHPILGDTRYAMMNEADPLLRNVPRQMLHAFKIEFTEPFTLARATATAPLPKDFKGLLSTLRS